MSQGRLAAQRQLAIGQAAVLFFDGGGEELEAFIRTGSLSSSGRKVVPCNTAVLEAMQQATEKRRGRR